MASVHIKFVGVYFREGPGVHSYTCYGPGELSCGMLYIFFPQEELRKFIKFACNQERIPFGNPCRDGGRDSDMNIPPYPMKIAPPDGSGEHHVAIIIHHTPSLPAERQW